MPSSRTAQPPGATANGIPVAVADPGGVYPPGAYTVSLPEVTGNQAARDAIREEQRKRAYFSLFSNNVALSYRKAPAGGGVRDFDCGRKSRPACRPGSIRCSSRCFPVESRTAGGVAIACVATACGNDRPTAGFRAVAGNAADTASTSGSSPSGSPEPSAAAGETRSRILQPEREGTTSCLKAQFLKRYSSTGLTAVFPGPVICLLSSNVYSHDRQHLSYPAGSKIVGEANKVDTFGQARFAVSLPSAHHARWLFAQPRPVQRAQPGRCRGAQRQGQSPLRQDIWSVNCHRILGRRGADRNRKRSEFQLYRPHPRRLWHRHGEWRRTHSRSILEHSSYRNHSGRLTRLKIYLSNDLLLPDYATHTMPSNL